MKNVEVLNLKSNPIDTSFIGRDGKSYTTPGALDAANAAYSSRMDRYKSPVTGKEYPATAAGHVQMEHAGLAFMVEKRIPVFVGPKIIK